MILPPTPWVDRDGNPTPAFRRLLQDITEAIGGPAYTIVRERVSDTSVRTRMKGADGIIRASTPETLS